jgi:hypothetical protein
MHRAKVSIIDDLKRTPPRLILQMGSVGGNEIIGQFYTDTVRLYPYPYGRNGQELQK